MSHCSVCRSQYRSKKQPHGLVLTIRKPPRRPGSEPEFSYNNRSESGRRAPPFPLLTIRAGYAASFPRPPAVDALPALFGSADPAVSTNPREGVYPLPEEYLHRVLDLTRAAKSVTVREAVNHVNGIDRQHYADSFLLIW